LAAFKPALDAKARPVTIAAAAVLIAACGELGCGARPSITFERFE
jgi:hypothetical protein